MKPYLLGCILYTPRTQVEVFGRRRLFTPEELLAIILARVKTLCEHRLHCPVASAAVVVPAYFNLLRRQAVRDACRIAGLTVVDMLSSPYVVEYQFCSLAQLHLLTYAVVPQGCGGRLVWACAPPPWRGSPAHHCHL